MRVSIFNCVSTALEMLKFSSESLLRNAGTECFDYLVVTWLPSPEVVDYLESLEDRYHGSELPTRVHIIEYHTDEQASYVGNLRGMMNRGFEASYCMNDYAGLVNTDMYFGRDWLAGLVRYADENLIVNSIHITPISGPHVVTADLGIPEAGKFNLLEFERLERELRGTGVVHQDQLGGDWRNVNTMPYLVHRKYWQQCGPWETEYSGRGDTPDRKFFQAVSDAGAKFVRSLESVVYHHEKAERSGKRPAGAEHLREG